MQYGVDKTSLLEYPAAITCSVLKFASLLVTICVFLVFGHKLTAVFIYLMHCMLLKFKNPVHVLFVLAFIGYKFSVMLLNIIDQNHLKMA